VDRHRSSRIKHAPHAHGERHRRLRRLRQPSSQHAPARSPQAPRPHTIELLGIEPVGGLACHTLKLSWTNDLRSWSETWWVGEHEFLLRKVFDRHQLGNDENSSIREKMLEAIEHARATNPDFPSNFEMPPLPRIEPCTVERTTTYSPTINAPIPDAAFNFTPPH
jgi:hypothetical protein